MKARLTTIATVLFASLFAVSGATAMPGGNATGKANAHPNSVKAIAIKECVALKRADKLAFKSSHGSIRECAADLRPEAANTRSDAARECKGERSADPEGFAATYGTPESNGRNALGKCVSSKVSDEIDEEAGEFENAADSCRAEQEADPEAFSAAYGTPQSNGRNAFGKCVSQKAQEQNGEDGTEEEEDDEDGPGGTPEGTPIPDGTPTPDGIPTPDGTPKP